MKPVHTIGGSDGNAEVLDDLVWPLDDGIGPVGDHEVSVLDLQRLHKRTFLGSRQPI